jgi:hypothetical protein
MGTFQVSSKTGMIARIQTAPKRVFRVDGTLRGPVGARGPEGRLVQLQSNGIFVQWRYVGDATWNNLVDIAALAGTDGREVELSNDGTNIRWRFVGDPTWTNLVALSTLKGDQGNPGTNGRTLLSGSGAPSNALGADGDFYIDTVAFNIYGPKASGAWAGGTSLVGPAGAGSGDVLGPASSTTNAIALYTGTTGKAIKNSLVTIDASGNIVTPGTVDGRDVSVDGTKLDGISAGANVTATALAPAIFAATAKTTPVDADTVGITDSAASNGLKKVTWANIKATLKTYFDGFYATITNLALKADDNAVVKLTGAQTVAGVKTFSSSPVVPTPASGTDAANKSYVDAGFGSNSFIIRPVAVTGTQNGSNLAFTAPEAYVAGSLGLIINGSVQDPTNDYTETSPAAGTFAFVGYAPISTDVIRVFYQKALTAVAGNADTVDGFHANATPTANAILPLNASAKVPWAALDMPYSEVTLASTYLHGSAIASGTYSDTGLSIVLPAAGTYEISCELRGDFSPSTTTPAWISWKLYDSTNSQYVPRAKRIGPIGISSGPNPVTGTTPMAVQYTVTGATTIKVYVARNNGAISGNVSVIGASADDYGQNVLRYKRIG